MRDEVWVCWVSREWSESGGFVCREYVVPLVCTENGEKFAGERYLERFDPEVHLPTKKAAIHKMIDTLIARKAVIQQKISELRTTLLNDEDEVQQ